MVILKRERGGERERDGEGGKSKRERIRERIANKERNIEKREQEVEKGRR